MPSALEMAPKGSSLEGLSQAGRSPAALVQQVVSWLDDAKAEEIVTISLDGKSSIADYMVIASGRSDRHVGAIAQQIQQKLKELGLGPVRIEGLDACDWVLVDAGDIMLHVFRPEVREFYNLEKMWAGDRPAVPQH
ncbi:MAG: ribosome silencing factor [Hyphomicrobiaceae bacterium]